MKKYYLKNWKTFPFRDKSFEGQLDRFAVACVTDVDAPNMVLDIVPAWGRDYNRGMGRFIKLLHQKEQGYELDNNSLEFMSNYYKPIDGEFIKVKSLHGPLFRIYTSMEAEYGLCKTSEVDIPERNSEGNVVIYDSITVFTWSIFDPDFQQYNYVRGWFPEEMYHKYAYYKYFPISQLKNFIG